MRKAAHFAVLIVVVAGIGVVIGILSRWPVYTHFPPDKAMITISFTVGGKPKGACHKLSREELLKLAPNMRRPTVCPRERRPVKVELAVDGKPIYSAVLPPTGLAKDGPSRVYRGFPVEPGKRRIVARLIDSDRKTGFDYEKSIDVTLRPRQDFIVDFQRDAGGFVFR